MIDIAKVIQVAAMNLQKSFIHSQKCYTAT